MKFQFTCNICTKEVKRGDKFEIQTNQYETNCSLSGTVSEDNVCHSCHGKVSSHIDRLKEKARRKA